MPIFAVDGENLQIFELAQVTNGHSRVSLAGLMDLFGKSGLDTRQSKLIEENGINFIVCKPLHLYCRRVDVLESFKFERIEGAREQHEAVANVRIDQNTGKQVNAGLVAVVKVIDN